MKLFSLLVLLEYIWRRHDDNKEFHFDTVTLKLTAVMSQSDNSWLKVIYENGIISKVQHSDGSYVQVKYNGQMRIQSMEKVTNMSRSEV